MATQDDINYLNQLAAQRRWYEKNKDNLKEKTKEYKLKNKEKLKEARKKREDAIRAGTWQKRSSGANFARRRLNVYKQNAKEDGREWTLTDEEALNLITGMCHYCGASPNKTNGIDRKDNSKGYKAMNVVSACWTCNRMKWTMKQEDFISHIKKVANKN